MSDESHQNYYDVLEVRADASFEEIEASYRGMLAYLAADSLAMYSMMEEAEVERLRTQVDEAYRTLRDPERRAAYDRSLGRVDVSYPPVVVPHTPSDSHVTIAGGTTAEPSFRTAATTHRTASVTLGHVVGASPSSTSAAAESQAPATTSAATSAPVAPAPVAAAPPTVAAAALPPIAASPVRMEPASRPFDTVPHHLTPVPPAARIFEAGTPVVPARPADSPLAVILKRPSSPAAARSVRRLFPKPDFEITPATEYTGALLRRLRESCGATLDDLSEITKVGKHYLRALEDGDVEALPAAVYVRGFVAEYARALGFDVNLVTKSYMAVYKRLKGEGG